MTGRQGLLASLGIYLATRLSTALMVVATAPGRVADLASLNGYHSVATAPLPPDYEAVMTSWDGQWYLDIALHGYANSPLGFGGHPAQTTLAFYPLFPMLVRGFMTVTGLGFGVVAPTVSMVAGGCGVLVVYRLVEDRLDRRRALGCVAMLCCFVSAPVLQAAYTEATALLLVATTLLLLARRRYLWALFPVLLLGFTRNIALVVLPVVVTHWVARTRDSHVRRDQRVPHVRISVLLVGTLVATAAWPLVAGVLGGRADAYFTTIKAWPGFTGSAFRPPWAAALTTAGTTAWLMTIMLLVVFARLLLSRPVRQWGPELWAWTGASIGFTILTTSASTSLPRYLLLAFPLGLVLMPPTQDRKTLRVQRVVVLAACLTGLALQWVWIRELLVYAGPQGGLGFP